VTEAEWLACEGAESIGKLVKLRLSARKSRLLACVCAREVVESVRCDTTLRAIEAAEGFLDGAVSHDELREVSYSASRGRDELGWAVAFVDAGYGAGCAVYCHAMHFARAAARGTDPRAQALLSAVCRGGRRQGLKRSWVLLQELAGPPPHLRGTFEPAWRTSTVIALARQMYVSRDFFAMPILADALQEADCMNEVLLNHCRGDGPHVRGCWVVDLVLGKE
jgi:hypothetical protein